MNPFGIARERVLARRFQSGCEESFLALVRLYERRLLYYLRRFERDPERALDALQEVWLTAWKTRGSLRSPEAFRSWVYRLAHGKIVEVIRRETRRHRAESVRNAVEPAVAHSADESIETVELVHFALARVSPEHRAVLTLRFLEEMTIPEIAVVLDCPEGTVKSRLHHAGRELLSIVRQQSLDEEQNHVVP
jgi:RNA polymerase sigma-70 factor, ECF subfamily